MNQENKTAEQFLNSKGIYMTDFISSSTYFAITKYLEEYAQLLVTHKTAEAIVICSLENVKKLEQKDKEIEEMKAQFKDYLETSYKGASLEEAKKEKPSKFQTTIDLARKHAIDKDGFESGVYKADILKLLYVIEEMENFMGSVSTEKEVAESRKSNSSTNEVKLYETLKKVGQGLEAMNGHDDAGDVLQGIEMLSETVAFSLDQYVKSSSSDIIPDTINLK